MNKQFKMHCKIEFDFVTEKEYYPQRIKTIQDACKFEMKDTTPIDLLNSIEKKEIRMKITPIR